MNHNFDDSPVDIVFYSNSSYIHASVLFSTILAAISKSGAYLDEFSKNASGNLSKDDLCVIARRRCNFFYKFPKCHTIASQRRTVRPR